MAKRLKKKDLTFRAVYGKKKGEVWETDFKLKEFDVQKQFKDYQEQMLSENGKIDLSVLFDPERQRNSNLENNELYKATEHLTDVFYLYDTIMVLHFIKECEQKDNNAKKKCYLIPEYINAVHKIIQIKWFGYLTALFLNAIDTEVLMNKKESVSLLLKYFIAFLFFIDYPFREPYWRVFSRGHVLIHLSDFLLKWRDFSRWQDWVDQLHFLDDNVLDKWDGFRNHIPEILKYIKDWNNDLIISLLSLEEDAIQKFRNEPKYCFFYCADLCCFETEQRTSDEEPFEDLFLIDLWTKIKNKLEENNKAKEYAVKKCVAINIDRQNKKIRYAISGMDNDISQRSTEEKSIKSKQESEKTENNIMLKRKANAIIRKIIKQEYNIAAFKIYRCSLARYDVLYITKDGKIEISFKKDIRNKINENNKLDKKNAIFEKIKNNFGRMFSCCERKLFSSLKNMDLVVFTSRPNCELCLTVHDKKEEYSQIKLLYPGKSPASHLQYDPIANDFLDYINEQQKE